jgi:hypothetical protein
LVRDSAIPRPNTEDNKVDEMKKILLIGAILFLLLFPSVNASMPDKEKPKGFVNWGFIIYQKYNLTAYHYGFGPMNDPNKWWGITFDISYRVIGFGRHTIRCEWNENLTYYYFNEQTQEPDFNKTMHYNESGISYEEHIWMFDLVRAPHIKPRAILTLGNPVDLCINGTVWARIYIDDALVWNDTVSAEHHM